MYRLLGRTQLAERQFPEAVRSYRKAASLGFDTEVLMGEATALWHSDDRQAAIAAMVKLTRLRPDLNWPREQPGQYEGQFEVYGDEGEAMNQRWMWIVIGSLAMAIFTGNFWVVRSAGTVKQEIVSASSQFSIRV